MRQLPSWLYAVVEPLVSPIVSSSACATLPRYGDGVIDDEITDKALTMLDVDHEGLDYVDQKILRTMIEMYGGGPVGLGTLSVNMPRSVRQSKICTNLT